MDAAAIIARFGLQPLPVEGGWFRRYWRAPADADTPDGTAILALLTDEPDGFSQFHRLTIDEIWHFYLGDPIELVVLDPGGTSRHVRLGPDVASDDEVVAVVTAGSWMAAQTIGQWSLFGTTMAPGFSSACYEGGDRERLIAGWPGERDAIVALTRPGSPGQIPSGS